MRQKEGLALKTPKEPADAKKDRLRERRMAELERVSATQRLAQGLTGDIRSTFGNRMSLMGYRATAIGKPAGLSLLGGSGGFGNRPK